MLASGACRWSPAHVVPSGVRPAPVAATRTADSGSADGVAKQQRFLAAVTRFVHRLERFSRPRLAFLFGYRVSDVVFGLLVIAGSIAAFVAPPFTGLDTLPALGVMVLSLAVLFEDALLAAGGLILLIVGLVLEIALGAATGSAPSCNCHHLTRPRTRHDDDRTGCHRHRCLTADTCWQPRARL